MSMTRGARGCVALSSVLAFACHGAAPGSQGGEEITGRDERVDGEEVLGAEDPSGELFRPGHVHQVEILIEAGDRQALVEEPYGWVPASVRFGDDPAMALELRLKGRIGSFREVTAKAAFKIRGGGESGRLFGMDRLNLNNMVQDGSQVREHLSYLVYRELEIPAPRTGYAWIVVNGEDYGLYAVVEAYDQVFLDRHYRYPSGNLYDGDYASLGPGEYTFVDFQEGLQDYFELDEGVDVGLADIREVTAALDESCRTAGFEDVLGELVDLELLATHWAADAWLGHLDGYSYHRNNYRIYFDPGSRRADMLPWDMDWTFHPGTTVTSPRGRLVACCWDHDACRARFLAALAEVEQVVRMVDLGGEIEAVTALVNPYVQVDPKRETSYDDVLSHQDHIRMWIAERWRVLEDTPGLF